MTVETVRAWLEVTALALSPLIAVRVDEFLKRRQLNYDRRLWVLSTLLATRHAPFADDKMRALNTIDVHFARSASVRQRYRSYLDSVTGRDLSNIDVIAEMNRRMQELVAAMASELHLDISAVDFSRGYIPNASLENHATSALTDTMLVHVPQPRAGETPIQPSDLFRPH